MSSLIQSSAKEKSEDLFLLNFLLSLLCYSMSERRMEEIEDLMLLIHSLLDYSEMLERNRM